MTRKFPVLLLLISLGGCAIIKTTDVTDAGYKRHQSVALLGWPVFSRVTDRESGVAPRLATKVDGANQAESIEEAEFLAEPIAPAMPMPRH
jgi:hypothetical protein